MLRRVPVSAMSARKVEVRGIDWTHSEMILGGLAVRVYILLVESVAYFIQLLAASRANISPAGILDLDARVSKREYWNRGRRRMQPCQTRYRRALQLC